MIAAGIVAFRPDAAALRALLTVLAPQAARRFVFVNAMIDEASLAAISDTGAELVRCEHNLGVGEALNMLALAASLAGCDRILTMDQDSNPPSDLVATLASRMDAAHAAGARPAVIGPTIVSPEQTATTYKPPRYFPAHKAASVERARAVRYVITSGSLIDLAAFRDIGPFRSDYFIDAIDVEWCFRAQARGYSCWVSDSARMEHRIGEGIVQPRLLGPAIPRQRPFRLYAYIRNQIYGLRLAHVPLGWRLRFAAHVARLAAVLAFSGERDLSFGRLIAPAFWSGVRGWLGPPPGAEAAPAAPIFPPRLRYRAG